VGVYHQRTGTPLGIRNSRITMFASVLASDLVNDLMIHAVGETLATILEAF
jgi:hypothetical protein